MRALQVLQSINRTRHQSKSAKDRIEEQPGRKAEAGEEKESQPQLVPSIVSEDASKISAQDVQDFVKIDLNLIDKKS